MQFIDLKAQQQQIRDQIDVAIARVLDHGQYIMGPEVFTLEEQLAEFCGVKHALTCANGTDAIVMALMAKNVQPNDAIFVPAYTFAATAGAVVRSGAVPVFVDCEPTTFNMDPLSLMRAIATAKNAGLNPAGVIIVDLFGQPADYALLVPITEEYKMWVMADAAQSFGASYMERKVGNVVDLTTTSFFPAKPLGCYGDGGAIFTNDDQIAATLKSIRIHGHGADPTQYVRVGLNGRFDTLQAAILIEKLKIFPQELIARQQLAEKYNAGLKDIVQTPAVMPHATSAWAQYTVVLPEGIDRQQLMADLKEAGVPSVVYYPRALHQQPIFKQYLTAANEPLKVCESLVSRVLSLPMSGYVSDQDAQRVIAAMQDVLVTV